MKKLIIKFVLSVSLIFVVSNTITFDLAAAESATSYTYSKSTLPDLPSEH